VKGLVFLAALLAGNALYEALDARLRGPRAVPDGA
jgi:hypothetical protein